MAIKKVSQITHVSKGMTKRMTNEQHKISKVKNELTQDKFESVENHQKRLDSEIAHFEYKVRKIEYFPEDVEKMKTMTHEEKNDYICMLKREGKYTYVEE